MAPLFGGLQIIRLVEEHRIDLLELHEFQDVDALRRLRIDLLEVVVGQDDVVALLVFVAFDDLFPRHGLVFNRADALVFDAPFVLSVQQVEREIVRPYRGEQFDGDRHQPEINRPRPYRVSHAAVLTPNGAIIPHRASPACRSKRAAPSPAPVPASRASTRARPTDLPYSAGVFARFSASIARRMPRGSLASSAAPRPRSTPAASTREHRRARGRHTGAPPFSRARPVPSPDKPPFSDVF